MKKYPASASAACELRETSCHKTRKRGISFHKVWTQEVRQQAAIKCRRYAAP